MEDFIDALQFIPVGAKHLLRFAARGDVAGRAKPFDDLTLIVHKRYRARGCPADRPVKPLHPVLELKHALGADGARNGIGDDGAVFGRNIFIHPCNCWTVGVRHEAAAVQLSHLLPVRAHPVNHV